MIKQNIDSEYLLDLYGSNVIASMTDLKGIITFVSNAYETISEYTADELLGQPHSIARHPDMPASAFKELWDTIQSGKTWRGEVKNIKKDGGFYWVKATITPYKNKDGKIVGYASIREDITAIKKIAVLHKQVTNMLDNIDEGFLIFDKNLKINEGYSKRCLEILNQENLTEKNISEILFSNDIEKKEIFDYAYSELLKTDDQLSKDLFLSLLPNEHHNNNYVFTIKYKLLANNKFLVLITDVTQQRELEKTIKHEQQMQKMIIAIATHKKEIIDLIKSFQNFIDKLNEKTILIQLKINLHTYKGLFAQLEMLYTTDAIHDIETTIKNKTLNIEMVIIFLKSNLELALNRDLKVISDILGDEFLSSTPFINVELEHIESIKNKAKSIIDSNIYDKTMLFDLLNDIESMQDQPLIDMLNIYSTTIKNISVSLKKEIYPLDIIGDKKLLISDSFKDFFDSLIHIFRNAMVHGIEYPEIRESLNKDKQGKILCNYKLIDNNIILTISDDGQGIDPANILNKAISLGVITKEQSLQLEEQEILQLIFNSEFTTNEDLNKMAGRGVGLSSVKYELSKLKGTITVKNVPNIGLTFIFTLPYQQTRISNIQDTNDAKKLIECITEVTKSFLTNNIGVKLLSIKTDEELNLDKYFSTIKFSGKIEIFCTVSISSELLDKIFNAFIPDGVSEQEKQKIIKSLPNEIINIIAGLAISKFPKKYQDLVMGTPVALDKDIIQAFQIDNLSATKKVQTSSGSLAYTVIIIKKD